MRPVHVAVVAAGAVFLVDPIGFGRMSATSTIRTVVMLAVLALAPLLIERERSLRGSPVRTAGRPALSEPASSGPADQPNAWARVRASMTLIASR